MHACTIHVHVHMKSLELNFLVQNINKKNQRRKNIYSSRHSGWWNMMTGKLFLNNIENPVNQTVTCTGEGGGARPKFAKFKYFKIYILNLLKI